MIAIVHFASRAFRQCARCVGFVALLLCTSAFAQLASTTTVTSNINPAASGQTVTLTAAINSAVLASNFPASVGASVGAALYYRYDLTNTRFQATVTNTALKNKTVPTAFANVVVSQGGAVGDTYVVFQVTAGTGGIVVAHVVQFDFTPTAPVATSAIGYSVHETASSSFGAMPANTSVLFRADPILTSAIAPPFTVTGAISWLANGATITSCPTAPIVGNGGQCQTTFPSGGRYTITVNYGGDVNYLASSGTLTGGQAVSLDVSPFVLPAATVGLPYTQDLTGVGAVSPAVFTLVSGDLPAGVSLSSSGTVFGTPTTAGPFEFTVRVVDALDVSGQRKLSLTVGKGNQTITFNPPASAAVGTTIPLNATASSGLAITYSISSPTVCNSSGADLRLTTTGTCSVTPNQSGDNNWFAAPTSVRNIAVTSPAGIQPLRVRSSAGVSQVGNLVGNQVQFTSMTDPGPNFRLLGLVDYDGNRTMDLAFLNLGQGDLGEVTLWPDVSPTNARILRSVRTLWRVDAVGDLDGDGFGDLVWRFTGQTPNFDDTGVSYVWFSNGNNTPVVRKRGGAPLTWTLLGAIDVNGDRAADMIYIDPSNNVRVLMATAGRSCANFAAGQIAEGFTALKAASFSATGRAEILIRNNTTGAVRLTRLDGTGLTLPPSTSDPNDPNASCTPSSLVVNSSASFLTATDPTWLFYATADFNGDGLADIIWLRPDGTFTVWLSAGDNLPTTTINNAGTAPTGFSPIVP
jgi:hypothetical protein